jgi:hypothetical protein
VDWVSTLKLTGTFPPTGVIAGDATAKSQVAFPFSAALIMAKVSCDDIGSWIRHSFNDARTRGLISHLVAQGTFPLMVIDVVAREAR